MSRDVNRAVVEKMWEALYQKEWDTVESCIAEDGHYEDVPTPDSGATGPANVVKRLRVASTTWSGSSTSCIGSLSMARTW